MSLNENKLKSLSHCAQSLICYCTVSADNRLRYKCEQAFWCVYRDGIRLLRVGVPIAILMCVLLCGVHFIVQVSRFIFEVHI